MGEQLNLVVMSDKELAERLTEERAIAGFMLELGFGRRAKEASDRIRLIQVEIFRREEWRERNRSGAV